MKFALITFDTRFYPHTNFYKNLFDIKTVIAKIRIIFNINITKSWCGGEQVSIIPGLHILNVQPVETKHPPPATLRVAMRAGHILLH